MKPLLLGTLLAAACFGQRLDPIQWALTSPTAKAPPGSKVTLHLTATMQEGWHLYSLTTPKGGPIQTTAGLAENPSVKSSRLFQPKPERQFDQNFKLDTETFEKQVDFAIEAELAPNAAAGPLEVTANVRYQACTSRQCLPPRKKTATFTISIDQAAAAPVAFPAPNGFSEVKDGAIVGQAVAAAKTEIPTSGAAPATSSAGEQTPAAASSPASSSSAAPENLAVFLLTAFGFGLAAIFTPCVFPMIPITVSFFLNHSHGAVPGAATPGEHRGGSLAQAGVFSLGIIVLFCALGMGVTAAVGPFGVNQLGSNPWVNGFISLVFGAFAFSLLGAFEITLPSGLLTKLDSASRRGGYFGTLLMGLTFALTSFACIGPFMGSLLVASVQSKGWQPVLGMVSFATGLASPFFLLAAFPSYLKKLPRSGGWLARVKVVMGFMLLAAMLKYLSNIDQVLQLGWLTRERFLASWSVLFAMAGLYLLGLLRLEGIEVHESLGVPRLLVASTLLVFSVSLLPGMFGAPLGELDAYVPAAASGNILSSRTAGEGPQVWMKNQYKVALDQARSESKLVLVTFTGYACTNCHWMKANMFPRPEIAEATKSLVLVELYTDGTDKESEDNQKLQDDKFQTVAIPYYAIMDPDGNVVSTFTKGMTTDTREFLSFLTAKPGKSLAQAF
ncbi:MAG: cytochrome c biogenesis protein CcdA [Bryobacteraceae bacterium]